MMRLVQASEYRTSPTDPVLAPGNIFVCIYETVKGKSGHPRDATAGCHATP
jgi:hypothetical protein